MTQATISPSDFVHRVAIDGLTTAGGKVRLNRYLCINPWNGGSDTAINLISKLKGLMDKHGGGPPFRNYNRMATGQGYVSDFMILWSWMHSHLDEVRTLTVQTASQRKTANGYTKVDGKTLKLAEVFKIGVSFPDGMAELIANGCFGWDCIGFVSQYLIKIGHLTEYPTWRSADYLTLGKFTPLKALTDIGPLCVLVFGESHIALVDNVYSIVVDEDSALRTATISVCQSYTGGPHTRRHCTLTQAAAKGAPIQQVGVIDMQSAVTVGRHDDLVACYPPYVAAAEAA
jgi:hypothetical protein